MSVECGRCDDQCETSAETSSVETSVPVCFLSPAEVQTNTKKQYIIITINRFLNVDDKGLS